MKNSSSLAASQLPAGRTVQKAVIALNHDGAARCRSRSRIVQTSAMGTAVPAPEAVAAATHLSPASPVAAAMTPAASQLLASAGGVQDAQPQASASGDPLLLLRCDAGHARHVTQLHMARRGLTALHPNVLLFVNLEELWLNDNDLTELRGVAPAPAMHHLAVPRGCLRLKRLFLSRNRIATLAGSDLPRLRHLEVLLLHGNRLAGLEAVSQQLAALAGLRQLDLSGNPLAEERNYREYIIAHHPSLEVLDRHAITDAERERALQLFPPVQVSKSRGTASVAFGTTVQNAAAATAADQQRPDAHSQSRGVFGGADEAPPRSSASAISYASSSAGGSSSVGGSRRSASGGGNRNGNGGGSGSTSGVGTAAHMSEMARVLEVRAQGVRNRRSALKAQADRAEETAFQECAAQHSAFHRQWEEAARQQIIAAAAQQQKEQLDAAAAVATSKGGGGAASKAAQAQQLQLQQQTPEQLAAAQLAAIIPAGSLPPLTRGVVPSIFDTRQQRRQQQQQQQQQQQPQQKQRSLAPGGGGGAVSLQNLLWMERDTAVFEQCLDEARRKEALQGGDADDATALRKAEAVAKAQAAALEELEAKSLRAAFAAGTQYAIRDLAFKVCDIVGMDPAKELEPLVRHFYADGRARHGRIDGAHVPRVLAEYVPFVEQRVEQLYARSNAAVRAQPAEATALLRRISTLNDYLSDSRAGFKAQRSAVGGAVAQQQQRR